MSSLRPTMHKLYRSHSSAKGGIPTDTNNQEGAGASPGANGATESTSLLQRHMPHVPKYYDDERPWVSYPAAFLHTSWLVLSSNYSNVLLVFVPLGLIAGLTKWDPVVVFCLNFLAIVPLAALLSFATEEISAKLGQTVGGLMNATFGNAVELIVSIIALYQGQIRIVQASMLGSILSNMLLVLGCCFIAGGIRSQGQQGHFDVTVASTMSSLMAVASACLIIPATLYAAIANADKTGGDGDGRPGRADENTIVLSRGTAIIMLCLYILYLFFQLKSHAFLFDEEAQQARNDAERGVEHTEEEESDGPQDGDILKPIPACICLVLVTVLVSFCADYLVESIDPIVEYAHISKTFIGLILIPIVGNAAEHVTAIVVSWKGKMNLALGVAIGSSMQIALFVTPFLVILGWIIHVPMTLHFQGFETVVFFLSVLVVNYLIQDGKSNYLEGCMCLGTYIIIALAFYVYPDTGTGAENINEMFKHFFDPVKG